MAADDGARRVQEAAEQFVDGLMADGTAPACNLPLLRVLVQQEQRAPEFVQVGAPLRCGGRCLLP